MTKHLTPAQAAGLIPDGAIVSVSSSSGLGCPDLMLKAIRGEYTGSGRTAAEGKRNEAGNESIPLFMIVLFVGAFLYFSFRNKGRRRGGWGYSGHGGPFIGGWSSGSGGGWGGSSGGGGGGFSGFSGGGGSFGGGGAGSDW